MGQNWTKSQISQVECKAIALVPTDFYDFFPFKFIIKSTDNTHQVRTVQLKLREFQGHKQARSEKV